MAGGAKQKVKRFHKLVGFILWRPGLSVWNLMTIQLIVNGIISVYKVEMSN